MARKLRTVVAGQALHVIQRGNDRPAVFFADKDDQQLELNYATTYSTYRA